MVVVGAAFVAQSPLRTLGGAAPVAAHLRLPPWYIATAPISAILDALSLLSLRQHLAMMASLLALWLAYRGARILAVRGRPARRELGMAALCVPLLVALYACLTLAPRPMAAIALDEPDDVVVDFHSHTSASHDGNPWFGVRENRGWHRAAGFDVAYVSDHGTYTAAAAASPLNPPRADGGTMLLPALELRCQGEHLVLLGSRRPALSSCIATTLDEPGVVAILTIPGNVRTPSTLPKVEAIEVADGAPRALDQMARDGRVLGAIADERGLARVASSNDHGWSHTAAAWSVVPIPGWRKLDARALDTAIRARVALGAASGIRVVERRRVVPAARFVPLALTAPAVLWQMLRALSPLERAVWVAWIWILQLVALAVRSRRARRTVDARGAETDRDVSLPGWESAAQVRA